MHVFKHSATATSKVNDWMIENGSGRIWVTNTQIDVEEDCYYLYVVIEDPDFAVSYRLALSEVLISYHEA